MNSKLFSISKQQRRQYLVRAITILIFLTSAAVILLAHSTGITGQTNQGCTCHGSSSSTTTLTPSSQSGSFTVQTNSTSTFTISVSNSSRNYFGIDLAVKTTSNGETNVGSLAASGNDLYSSNGELTHTGPKNGTGGTSFTFTWTSPSTAGTYYLKAAGNAVNNNGTNTGDLWNFMSTQTITVVAPTEIVLTSPNGGESWCAGSSRNVTWTSSSVTNINIDLSTNGGSTYTTTLATNVTASTGSWSWNIPSGQAVGSSYRIRLSDASNPNINDASASNFSIAPATSITSQPQSVTSCSGLQVQFSVTATGSNLTYQWRKDGVNISGGTGSTLTLSNVQTTNAGSYTCVVTGACGSPITSSSATLTVEPSPQITANPAPQSVCSGQPATFSVTATGEQLTYQWRKNGSPVPAGTTATLTLSSAKESDAGNYDCVVSGKCAPAVTSTAAVLTVNSPPAIVTQPKPLTACEGSNSFIYIQASGGGLTYIWMKNGVIIANTNNDTLFFKNVSISDAGFYSVKVTGDCSPSVTSSASTVTINPLAMITQQPENQTVTEGNSVNFSVSAQGTGLSYQWYKNSEKLIGQTTPIINLTTVKLSDAGFYHCLIANSCGNKSSDTAQLSVIPAGNGPVLTLTKSTFDFGYSQIAERKTKVLTSAIINSGNEALTITSITITGTNAAEFGLDNIQLPITLSAGQTLDLTLWFMPESEGAKSAVVNFTSNSVTDPKLNLTGSGATFDVKVNLSELNISSIDIGTRSEGTVKLENNSSIDVRFSAKLTGTDSSSFSFKDNYENVFLAKGTSVDLVVVFNPASSDTKHANLEISIAENGQLFSLPVTGTVTTGIDGIESQRPVVYPIPGNNEITIDLSTVSQEIQLLQIYDVNGKEIISVQGDLLKNIYNWNLVNKEGSLVNSGVYSLIIKTNKQIFTYPIVIIR